MLHKTRKFIEKEQLFTKGHHLLAAVSGGVDSMVMLDVLCTLGYSVGVCHLNYRLRGVDSDEDCSLVKSYCSKKNIDFHMFKASEEDIREMKKGNLQEKARTMRYHFFEDVMERFNYDFTCLAHHSDDVAETFLINALRGSGSKGLAAIAPIRDKYRRPLLPLSKEEILRYAYKNTVPFRQDSTNLETRYNRNFLRNDVLPLLTKRFPAATRSLAESSFLLQNEFRLLEYLATLESEKWMEENPEGLAIRQISEIRQIPGAVSLLHHWLQLYGFSKDQVKKMLDTHESGAQFASSTHTAYFDRDHLYIRNGEKMDLEFLHIPGPGIYRTSAGNTLIIKKIHDFSFSKDPYIEIVDGASIRFPLTLRTWRKGDRICPLGMDGRHKMMSDWFIEKKIPVFKKKLVPLLCKGQDVFWIIGYRLSEKLRLTASTRDVFLVQWVPGE